MLLFPRTYLNLLPPGIFFRRVFYSFSVFQLLFLAGVLCLPACESAQVRQLDAQIAQMIRQQQQETLGRQGLAEAVPPPPKEENTHEQKKDYLTTPNTFNPNSSDLPALTNLSPTSAPATTQPVASSPAPSGSIPFTQPSIPSSQPGFVSPASSPSTSQPTPSTSSDTPSDVTALDLEKVIAFAIANSREYRNRKEDLFIAAIDLLLEQHLWGPRFFDTINARMEGTPETGDHDQALKLTNELGVRQRLPYGGEVSAKAVVNYINHIHTITTSTDPYRRSQDAALVFSAIVPLARGAGETARESLIQSQRNMVYAVRSFEQYRREFIVSIARTYYDLLLAQARIENRRRILLNYDWLANRTAAMAKAGRVSYVEVQRSQQQALFARNDLRNARESYASSLDSFKITIGMDVQKPLSLQPVQVIVNAPALDMEKSVSAARTLRLDLQTSANKIEDARRKVQVARNQQLPDIDFFADLTIPTDTNRQYAGFRMDASDATYSAGIKADLPLDRRQEELKVRKAFVDLERASRSYDLLQDQAALAVRRTIRQIEEARYSLEIQDRNIQLAQTRRRGVMLRLDKLGPRDFIDSERDLLDALDRRDQALRDYRSAILQYLLDSGQLRVDSAGHWLMPGQIVSAVSVASDSSQTQPSDMDTYSDSTATSATHPTSPPSTQPQP